MLLLLQNRPKAHTPAERRAGVSEWVPVAHRRAQRSLISDFPPGIQRPGVTIADGISHMSLGVPYVIGVILV